MDRATFTLLQTPFARGSDEASTSPEGLREAWMDLTNRIIQILIGEPAMAGSSIMSFLQRVRGEFDIRTAPAALVWTSQSLRPISSSGRDIFLEQLETTIKDAPANVPPLALALAAQWLFEFKYIFALYPSPRRSNDLGAYPTDATIDLGIAAEVANYAAFRNDGQELERRIANALENHRAQFETLMLEGQQSVNKLNTNIIDLQSKDEDLRTKINVYEETLKDQVKKSAAADTVLSDLGKRVVASDENIEKFTKAIERKYAMGATRDYWNNQAKSAGRAFWVSVFIVAVLLIGGSITLVACHAKILSALQDILITPENLKPDLTLMQLTVASVNRLILIVLPVALVIWFTRLVVRFTNRSLALMDDARLRQAMMDTFLRLDVDSDLSKEERNVMLSALYRPGPGQSPDLPDFPNVIELINRLPGAKP